MMKPVTRKQRIDSARERVVVELDFCGNSRGQIRRAGFDGTGTMSCAGSDHHNKTRRCLMTSGRSKDEGLKKGCTLERKLSTVS